MRRHVIPLFLLFGILFACGYVLLNTTWLLSNLVPQLAKIYLKSIELESFELKEQSFALPDTITLQQVKCAFTHKDVRYEVEAEHVIIYEAKKLTGIPPQIKVSIDGLNVVSPRWQTNKSDLRFLVMISGNTFSSLEGIFRLATLTVPPYQLENVIGKITGDPTHWKIADFTGNVYGGNFKGQISGENKPQVTYTVWIEANGIQTQELERVQLPLFSGFSGKLDGSFRLIAEPQRILILDTNLSMPDGGRFSASLTQHLINRISDVEKQGELDEILHEQKQFSFDKASIRIRNIDDQKATVTFDIRNDKEKVRLKESLEAGDIKKTAMRYLLPLKGP